MLQDYSISGFLQLYIEICVCVCVCVYVCMYVCMYVRMFVRTWAVWKVRGLAAVRRFYAEGGGDC
jgi:hypothetical protein